MGATLVLANLETLKIGRIFKHKWSFGYFVSRTLMTFKECNSIFKLNTWSISFHSLIHTFFFSCSLESLCIPLPK